MNHWNSTFKVKGQKPIARRSGLNFYSKSPASATKRRIQALLRSICLERDSGCILQNVRCGAKLGDLGVVWQSDHLVTRGNSATYGDSRLVVLICKRCHAWKSTGGNANKAEYDALVRTILPKEKVALWDLAEAERGKHKGVKIDWIATELALQLELKKLQEVNKI